MMNIDEWYDEISGIANEVIGAIIEELEKRGTDPIAVTGGCYNWSGARIVSVYLKDDDVYFDTEYYKEELLREEPVNAIMSVAEYLNDLTE